MLIVFVDNIFNESAEELLENTQLIDSHTSDHMMLGLNLKVEIKQGQREVITWSEQAIEPPKHWTALRKKVRSRLAKRIIDINNPKQKEWWDEGCHKAMLKFKEMKTKYKTADTQEEPFLQSRRIHGERTTRSGNSTSQSSLMRQ